MAEDTKQTQAQLDLQLQINKVLQDRQAVLKAQEKALSGQVQLAIDLCKALKCEELDKVEERLKTTREAMAAAAEEAGRLGGRLDDIGSKGSDAGKKATGALGSLSKHLTTGRLATAGFGLGILRFGGIFVQTFKNILEMAGGLVMTLGKVGFSILTLPLNLLSGLFSLAQAGGGGGPSPILLELENIRKEMGGLAQGAGAAAASALPQFREQLSNLAGTGLSVRKVFGLGREGLAKAMAYNLELMKALGPAVDGFNSVMKKSAVELAMYRKGLGLTAEQQALMMKQAQAVGRDPVDAQREFASMAINMGAQFGMSASAIGKDMAEMKADFASFGTLSTRELGQAAVFARKLGIEVKALQGLVGQFDDFETAAQNAAKLSQAFGMNIDAMKMMAAQNPAERLSMLQKAFRETGKSVEQMSRQELKLLAAQSGLSEEAASLAFSQRGLSMSYDQVQKAGAKAEKKQLTQAEAMSKLADSIERVFGSGGGTQFKGFFDAFTQGFSRGIMKSQEFMKLFRGIRQSLKAVYWGSVEIGKQFVKLFPGIADMTKGLGGIFNPQRFRSLMKELKGIFTKFFGDLRTDPKAGVETFIKSFKDVQRLQTQLDQYTDLTDEQKQEIEQTLPKDTLRAFRGAYLETAQRLREQRDKPGPDINPAVDDLDFEFVLFASATIDYDYIMNLISRFTEQDPKKLKISREQLIGLIESDAKFMDERDEIAEYVRSLEIGKGLDENQVKAGYQQFKAQKQAKELADLAAKHGLPTDRLSDFVEGILNRMIFDGEQLVDLLAPLDLAWRERTQRELALMDDLVPLLKKRASGRAISGLSAYEQ